MCVLCDFCYNLSFIIQNSTRASENGLGDDVKEDEEEDENDEDEKMSNGTEFDPERLKAFNVSPLIYSFSYL